MKYPKLFKSLLNCGLVAHSELNSPAKNQQGKPRVFYGGALAGAKGGPQVKLGLLKSEFPQVFYRYNIVYLLSGALRLPNRALDTIRSKNIPVVMNQNGVFYPAWAPHMWQIGNEKMAEAMRRSDFVFYQSEFCRKCADLYLGVQPKQYRILYNAVDTDRFTPRSTGRRSQNESGAFKFLVSGNISSSTFYRLINAVEGLAEARRHSVNAELVIAGYIPDHLAENLYKIINQSGLLSHVKVLGPYSRYQAPEIYRSVDGYLITKHNDPCPNVVLEAMASGLPVLYSASGGVPELVGPGAGIGLQVPETFDEQPVPDVKEIASGMAEVIERRRAMAVAARRRSEDKFSLDVWFSAHREVFASLLKR